MIQKGGEINLKLKLSSDDAKRVIADLSNKFADLEKLSQLDLGIEKLQGVGQLITQLEGLDKVLVGLCKNAELVGDSLGEELTSSFNGVIGAFQKGSGLSESFLDELNEIAKETDKSVIPTKIKDLVKRINLEFKNAGLSSTIDINSILGMGDFKQQFAELANHITKFTTSWGAGMTYAADQSNVLFNKIGHLVVKLNELRDAEKSAGDIFKTLSSDGEFNKLSAKEKKEIDDFAKNTLDKYNKAKEIFTSTQSSLDDRRQAAIDMANAAKDAVRALSYEDHDFEISDMVDQDIIKGLGKIQKDVLSYTAKIQSTLRDSIADTESQLANEGINVKTQVNVNPKADPKAGKKIKQAVEDSAPESVDVPVQANIDTEEAKEILSIVEQLHNAFDIGHKKNTLEYKIFFTTDGLDIRDGDFQGVSSKTYAEALLGNLSNGINVNAHSHMGKYSEFTLADIQSAVDAKKNLGINLSAVIGPDDIATLDLTQVKLEDLYTLLEKLSKLQYSSATGIQAKDLHKLLKEINPEYGDIFAKWKPEKFVELAKYIDNVSKSTQSTIEPLEQFKNIVTFIASKDIDFSKYQKELNSLSENNFSPESLKKAFNEIAKAEKLMSDGKTLKIDLPEKSTLDAVTKSLQDQIDAYKTKRKEAGFTFDKLRQEILMLEGNHYDTKGSFIERFFHPAELDDVIQTLKSGGSVKAITEKLASEFNIEIPVKTKVDTKSLEADYQKIVDIVNQIAEKQKEIKELPEPTKNVDMVGGFVKDYGNLDEFKEKIKDVFNEYYRLQRELNAIPADERSPSKIRELEEYKAEIAGLVISAQNAKFNLDDLFNGKQLTTINSSRAGIQDLISQWREYDDAVGDIIISNLPAERSIDSLRDSILELAKAANASKDVRNTISSMLIWSDADTDWNKLSNTIYGLISGKIIPEITTFKQELANMFPDTGIDDLKIKYGLLFSDVERGSLTAAQALKQIEDQEKAIAEAARRREESQRKANEKGNTTPKTGSSGGSGVGTGSGTGSGVGVGAVGTSTSSGTQTGGSTNVEIADLERLKQKVSEVELEVIKKTRAFNDEKTAVANVVTDEISNLEKLLTKIKQIAGEVNNYSTAWSNADGNISGVTSKEGQLFEELRIKLQGIANVLSKEINNITIDISGGHVDESVSLYDKILEKVKQIAAERNKFRDLPDNDRLDDIDGSIRTWEMYSKTIEQAQDGINKLIESIKYIKTLDKSVGVDKYAFENGGIKDQRLVDIIDSVKGSDAPWLHSWEDVINNIQAKCINLIQFIQSNNGKLEDFLTPDQIGTLNEFGIDKTIADLEKYTEATVQIRSTNKSAQESIEKLVVDILTIAKAANASSVAIEELDRHLNRMRLPKHEMAGVNEETDYVISRIDKNWSERGKQSSDDTSNSNSQIDSKLASTIESLNSTLSKLIGSNDSSSQNTDPNKGLSGIATNVANIYGILQNSQIDDEKDSEKNATDDDVKLSSTISNLNDTLLKMVGSTDPASQSADPSHGISGIAENVQNIYGVLSGKQSDDSLSVSIKSAVEELSNASKVIADDAKLRQESNTKYQAASDRISTDAGRADILSRALGSYSEDYFIPKEASTKYSASTGGIVKVETVLQGLDNKFYDFAATVDSQGVVAVQKMEENGSKSISVQNQLIEQEKALAKAREEAAKKAKKETAGEYLERTKQEQLAKARNISYDVVKGEVDATKKSYDNFAAANTGNIPDDLKNNYNAFLKIVQGIRNENRDLTKEEAATIEAFCKGIQKEIDVIKSKNTALDTQVGLIEQYGKSYTDIDSKLSGDNINSLFGEEDANKAKKLLGDIKAELDTLQKEDGDGLKLLGNEELDASKNRLKELTSELQKMIDTAEKSSTKGAFTKEYDKQLTNATNALNNFKNATKGIDLASGAKDLENQLTAAVQRLNDMRSTFENTSKGSLTDEQKSQWQSAVNEVNNYKSALDQMLKVYQKVAGQQGVSINDISPGTDVGDSEQMYNAMRQYLEMLGYSDAEIKKFNANNKQLTATFVDADGTIKNVVVSYSALNGELSRSITPVKQVESVWSKMATSLGKKFREMASYFATFGSVYQIIGVVKQGINYIREIDKALTELKKVTNETEEAYNSFLQTASKTAGRIGSTVAEITNATADFARLGYDIEQAAALAEAATIYKNVGDGIEDVSQASESIISTMQAFGYEAKDAMTIVDKFNEVGNNFAITSTGIGEALKRSASALFTAGSTLDDAIGLIAGANTVIQDPEKVGRLICPTA